MKHQNKKQVGVEISQHSGRLAAKNGPTRGVLKPRAWLQPSARMREVHRRHGRVVRRGQGIYKWVENADETLRRGATGVDDAR